MIPADHRRDSRCAFATFIMVAAAIFAHVPNAMGIDVQEGAFASADAHAYDDAYDFGAYYEGSDVDEGLSATVTDASHAAASQGPAPGVPSQPVCKCGAPVCQSCAKQRALETAAAAAYKPLFYDNAFGYLNDPCYDNWHVGENAKQVGCGDRSTIDLGGQYRLRYHSEHNLRAKPLTGADDDFLLHRTRLFANVRYGDWFRFYGEAIDATSNGQKLPPRPIEVNRFDALNLFGDFKIWEEDGNQVWIRPGRQELLYSDERLVSPLDWSNTRRTFDGVKAYWRGAQWDIDGWWTRPVPFGQHVAGGLQDHNLDRPEWDQDFAGLWARYKTDNDRALEAFYLRHGDYRGVRRNVNGDIGDVEYNMFGGRLLGEAFGLLYEAWGGYQFGEWAADDVTAGVFTVGLGKKLSDAGWTPTLWAYYDWASGDHNLNDGKVATSSQFFPLAHKYLGQMDIIGRKNIQDVNVLLMMNPAEDVKFHIWYHAFFLQSRFDALYDAGGDPIYHDPTGSSGSQVGQELDLLLQWTFAPRMDLWFGYSHFFADDYFDSPVIQNGPAGLATNGASGKDADFFYTQFTINF